MKTMEWRKPAISLYHERLDKPETEPFAVIKSQKIKLEAKGDGGFQGAISDFFTLMGDVEVISTPGGMKDRYVLCWFDDSIDSFREGFRRLNGVTFPSGLSCQTSERKRTYNATFYAASGKVE